MASGNASMENKSFTSFEDPICMLPREDEHNRNSNKIWNGLSIFEMEYGAHQDGSKTRDSPKTGKIERSKTRRRAEIREELKGINIRRLTRLSEVEVDRKFQNFLNNMQEWDNVSNVQLDEWDIQKRRGPTESTGKIARDEAVVKKGVAADGADAVIQPTHLATNDPAVAILEADDELNRWITKRLRNLKNMERQHKRTKNRDLI